MRSLGTKPPEWKAATRLRPLAALAAPAALAALLLAAACDAPPANKVAQDGQASGESGGEPLRIAFIAYQNPDQLLESVEPVAEYLEGAIGRPVEAFASTDYAGIVEALKAGTADIGFMGPLQYVIAHAQSGAVPILGEVYSGSSTYVSKIFVRKDSGIATLADLENRSMAFVDPLSSSGYMYPLDAFIRDGIFESPRAAEAYFRKVYFAGGDEQAIRAVLNKFVDAAGVGEYSVRLLRPEEREQLTEIAESRPIPSHCVVAAGGLDPEVAAAFRDAMLALNDGHHSDLLRSLYAVDGYVAADHETYAEVARLARDYGFLG